MILPDRGWVGRNLVVGAVRIDPDWVNMAVTLVSPGWAPFPFSALSAPA